MANKIKLGRATKTRIENIKATLDDYEIVYATDTDEIGVKKPDGGVNYIGGGSGVDLDALPYMNYAADIYYKERKQNLFENAWEHSLTVDPSEIERVSTISTQYGKLQYPNGEDNGVIIPDSVTSIGDSAFDNWRANNQPLVIPNSVTSIGNNAFSSWYANNQQLVIPNSVTSIGDTAFDNWTSNNQPLVIPNSVTSIGNGAFSNWQSNNQPLVIPNSVTSIGNGAFYYWEANNHPLVILNSVTSIGNYAFGDWTAVPYVEIQAITPPTLANTNAFGGQNNAPIYVPHNSVDDYKEATNWVDLADRIFPISDKADLMDDIADLQENKQDKLVAGDNITIEDNVISASGGSGVDLDALPYMNYAANIYYKGGSQTLFSNAWQDMKEVDGAEIERDSTTSIQYGKLQYPNGEDNGVIIPHSVTSIGKYAFSSWTSNNQPLVIPNSVTSIESNAFSYWTSNNQPLVIPNSVTSIERYAFGYWQKNKHPLVIPESVTSIGINAFVFWVLVPYIEIQAITPPTLANSNAFDNQSNAPIYVPNDSVDDYKEATQWVKLADRIFPISDKGNTYTKGEIDLMIGDIKSALDAILGV